jgi:hypothetical protein
MTHNAAVYLETTNFTRHIYRAIRILFVAFSLSIVLSILPSTQALGRHDRPRNPGFGGLYKAGNLSHCVPNYRHRHTTFKRRGTLSFDAPRGRFTIKLGIVVLVVSTLHQLGGEEVFARGW